MRGAVAARSVRIGQAQGARHRTRSSCSLAGLSPALPCRTFGAHDQRPVLEHTPLCGLNAAADSAFGDGARGAQGDDEASYFIKQLRALPWNRAAIWLLVAAAFTQVKDFFGVRPRSCLQAHSIGQPRPGTHQPSALWRSPEPKST